LMAGLNSHFLMVGLKFGIPCNKVKFHNIS
jgi:hypothetical protein